MIDANIYITLQIMQAYVSPPIASVFLLGLFWKGATGKGAFASLVAGGVFGFLKIFTVFSDGSLFGHSLIFEYYSDINYLHFAAVLFAICTAVNVFVSLFVKEDKKVAITDMDYSFGGNNPVAIDADAKKREVIINKH
jgi:SSS family solute:Na+ symporter